MRSGFKFSYHQAVRAEIGKKIFRAGPGPKFCIWFRARPELDRNYFSLLRAGPVRAKIAAMHAGPCPNLKNPLRAYL